MMMMMVMMMMMMMVVMMMSAWDSGRSLTGGSTIVSNTNPNTKPNPETDGQQSAYTTKQLLTFTSLQVYKL